MKPRTADASTATTSAPGEVERKCVTAPSPMTLNGSRIITFNETKRLVRAGSSGRRVGRRIRASSCRRRPATSSDEHQTKRDDGEDPEQREARGADEG